MGIIKSPIFYMGKQICWLLPNLLTYFPPPGQCLQTYSVEGINCLNVPYDNVRYNELNENIFELLKTIITAPNDTIKHIKK